MTITFGHIIDRLTAGVVRPDPTVDKLDPGSLETEVRGIVTAFAASHYVIEEAALFGANLIVTHEGVYYSHQDQREWLGGDPVFLQKSALIASSGIGIYRFHDDVHRYTPDGITEGLIRALGWEDYVTEHRAAVSILTIPAMSVKDAAEMVKRQLAISYLRVAGNLAASCTRVGILVGYRGGGSMTIPLFEQDGLDLIIAGEGPEWETPEYVKDAAAQARNRALMMLGHAESEAPGMKLLAERLSQQFPGLPVRFVQDRPVFQIL
ncbi:Nif3-like dinuclear metal center hexameric protein [Paenibacillus tianjinensis]|uniref:GTP cyclohydrolase 1 type 2 homolog n=1 Tax=Paenibacillus tianjinensis TaxID=2810347 RepID=A0ABX7L8X8_9BACL|nr:Nif3-like dinuclear metal center hexameric protein [Paenibacillus tianjinensis]QSF43741.1 Nif3-like dinuclear metal center hexameric protein [Paenibacillus tianjinensis]